MLRTVTLIALLALVPLASAQTAQGQAFGLDLGQVKVGDWQAYGWNVGAGARTIDLSWGASTFPIPFADYDLRLYRIGSLDDGTLTDDELLANSHQHGGPTPEHIGYTIPLAGEYVIAVLPWQAQGEVFSLTTSAGSYTFVADAPGIIISNE